MIAPDFLDRFKKRLDRISRQDLESYALELIQERELLFALLDHVPEGIMVLSEGGEIGFINHRMAQLLDLHSPTPTKLSLNDALQDQDLRRLILKSLKQKNEVFDQELELLLPRPMIAAVTFFFTKHRNQRIAVLLLRNITHREQGVRERFKLENLETLTGLAAGLAHEIGNPLNSLSIHLRLLSKTISESNLKEKSRLQKPVRVMEDETRRLDQIVRNFLRATRRKPIKFELAQINDTIKKCVTFLEPELREHRIVIREKLDQDIPDFLIDSERIQQIFLNFIKNAIHAMPKGGDLSIKTELKGKVCIISFEDTGTGIPEDQLPNIFDAYFTTKEEGSGLGLMIAHQIVREHGGQIEVTTKLKQGTKFSITLPIRKEKLRLPEPTTMESST